MGNPNNIPSFGSYDGNDYEFEIKFPQVTKNNFIPFSVATWNHVVERVSTIFHKLWKHSQISEYPYPNVTQSLIFTPLFFNPIEYFKIKLQPPRQIKRKFGDVRKESQREHVKVAKKALGDVGFDGIHLTLVCQRISNESSLQEQAGEASSSPALSSPTNESGNMDAEKSSYLLL
jgi:hypothetical protein